MVKDFFYNGYILKEINKMFLTLIPNFENPQSTNHFKSISLCNVYYKIKAKILIDRIKHLLIKMIFPLQGVFALGRLMNENIMLAHEFCIILKRKIGKWDT